MSLCTEVEGLGERADLRVLRPPPGLNAPRLWCTAEQRDEAVMTKSLPSSPSREAAVAAPLPSGLGYSAPRRTRPSMGGCCWPPPAASLLLPGPATGQGPAARPCTLPGVGGPPRVPPSLDAPPGPAAGRGPAPPPPTSFGVGGDYAHSPWGGGNCGPPSPIVFLGAPPPSGHRATGRWRS